MMPKKGRRELTVDDTLYHYTVKKVSRRERSVVIQNVSTLRIHTATLRQEAVTPSDVKDVINDTGI